MNSTPNNSGSGDAADPLKTLYPLVDENEAPLPRCWNSKDKYNFIGLSQNNLRVHYRGNGKGHKDAASVRATFPIPAACGLYYFEVKIVSKGRDGYMGIGLSAAGVNMNRLPGWDKHSYGYHGDDGHSFCSSGTGQPYGPTFTTGDVIGCGVNLVDNTCFYTKNGIYLGIAFTDLPGNLYPTVGLQTPGEVIDANFGQEPFVFDIEDMMNQLRVRTKQRIENYPIPDEYRNWEGIMNKMVMSYLVHHGYCSTAEAFAKTCGQAVAEDLVSMQNRQKIQQLVLEGHIPEAEEETRNLYPNLLESNPDLLFMLRCRHFVELVGDSMSHAKSQSGLTSSSSSANNKGSPSCNGNTKDSPHNNNHESNMDVVYTNGYQNGCADEEMDVEMQSSTPTCKKSEVATPAEPTEKPSSCTTTTTTNGVKCTSSTTNGLCKSSSPKANGTATDTSSLINSSGINAVLATGRELQSLSVAMRRIYGHNDANKELMENAFSLLAYADPWNSPVGWQLSSRQREPVCAALNSAILQSIELPRTPPLQVAINHAHLLISQQARAALGACAFVDLDMHARDIK